MRSMETSININNALLYNYWTWKSLMPYFNT